MRLLLLGTLAIFSWTPRCSDAAFSGFPITNSGLYSWAEINASNAPLSQIYTAIVERCEITGITPPQWTQTLYVENATGMPFTVDVTNALGPVTVPGASATAYPIVSRDMLGALDSKIESLIPYFVMTNSVTNGVVFTPMSKINLFPSIGVGRVYTNMLTSNVCASWTRSPERRWNETLVEMIYNGSNWSTTISGATEWMSAGLTDDNWFTDGTPLPAIEFGPTGSTWTVQLAGKDISGTNQTETVTVGSICTVPWHSITSPPMISGFTGTTGAWFRVVYTNNITVYGERPWRLYASDLDERWKVLDALRMTAQNAYWSTNGVRYEGQGYRTVIGTNDPDWTAMQAYAETHWTSVGWTYSPFYGASVGNNMYIDNDYPQDKGYATLAGSFGKQYTYGIHTNTSKAVEFFVFFDASADIAGAESSENHFVEVDDFGTGYTTGKWHSVTIMPEDTEDSAFSETYVPSVPGTQPLPWVETPPARTNSSDRLLWQKTTGRSTGNKALIHWKFKF